VGIGQSPPLLDLAFDAANPLDYFSPASATFAFPHKKLLAEKTFKKLVVPFDVSLGGLLLQTE
jgi:hypothetical protein